MGITSRKPRPLDRSQATRDATLFVIATEGEVTEPEYFKTFRSSRIQVKVLNTENGASAPDKVLERMQEFKKQFDLKEDDQLFLVIDTDRWPPQALSAVAKSCVEQRFTLSVSNPCFEVWLALHFFECHEIKASSKDLNEQLKSHLGGYNKSINPAWITRERVIAACKNAKIMDTKPTDRWPQTTGSRVYLIMDELIKTLNS